MASQDPAKAVKTAVAAVWATEHPTWTVTLHVDDDYKPTANQPTLLVADDGGPRVVGDSWSLGQTPRRITLRLTAFAVGRDEARQVVDAAADHIIENRPEVLSRIEDVSAPLITRDRGTGAFLVSITMPAIVRPS